MGLTKKQEDFCVKYVETGNASEAYRYAYDTKRMKTETINNSAHKMIKNGEVTARISELKAKAEKIANKAFEITIETLINELEEARGIALGAETPQSSAAVSATMAKAKLLGLDVKKIDLTSSDESMSPKSFADLYNAKS